MMLIAVIKENGNGRRVLLPLCSLHVFTLTCRRKLKNKIQQKNKQTLKQYCYVVNRCKKGFSILFHRRFHIHSYVSCVANLTIASILNNRLKTKIKKMFPEYTAPLNEVRDELNTRK